MDSIPTTIDLRHRALENLRFIRSTMTSARTFTSVPSWGNVLIGLLGLVAATVASGRPTPQLQAQVWLGIAPLAASLGLWHLYRQSRRCDQSLLCGSGRRFLMALVPALLVAALLTPVLYGRNCADLLPACWLLLYGCGTITCGLLSLGHLVAMGTGFLLLGCLALLAPYAWSNLLMGLGFGGLHIAVGLVLVKRRYD